MEEVIDVVQSLNERLWGDEALINLDHCFEYSLYGVVEAIAFNVNTDSGTVKFDVWNDQYDGRNYYEETDSYEPLEECVLRRIKEMLSITNSIIDGI